MYRRRRIDQNALRRNGYLIFGSGHEWKFFSLATLHTMRICTSREQTYADWRDQSDGYKLVVLILRFWHWFLTFSEVYCIPAFVMPSIEGALHLRAVQFWKNIPEYFGHTQTIDSFWYGEIKGKSMRTICECFWPWIASWHFASAPIDHKIPYTSHNNPMQYPNERIAIVVLRRNNDRIYTVKCVQRGLHSFFRGILGRICR